MKKLLCAVLVLALCFTSFGSLSAFAAENVLISSTDFTVKLFRTYTKASGSCGDDLSWKLYSDGTLIISGSGEMEDYARDYDQPWQGYDKYIDSIEISDGVTSIGSHAFGELYNFTSISIPDSVTSIGAYAFYRCLGLESVTVPDSVISIGDNVFYGCLALLSVTLGSSVSDIGEFAFFSTDSLTAINVSEDNVYFRDQDGVLFDSNETTLLLYPSNKSGESYEIPSGVSMIDKYAFNGCVYLNSVIIPDSVTVIGEYAFDGCTGLSEISISDNITKIDEGVFGYCISLVSIEIPDGVTEIGSKAFRECSALTSITIPLSVTQISEYAFDQCDSLTTVYYSGTESQWDEINIEDGNDSLLNAMNNFAEFPVSLEDTEVILRNTETYYLHAEINDSYFDVYNDEVEDALDALSFSSDDESVASVLSTYSYNSVTGEVLFPLEIGTTGTAVIYAENENGTEISFEVNVVLFLKSGTDTNQFTHSALSWTFTNTDYKDQLWANASSIWESICLNVNYGETAGVCHAISYTMGLGQQGLLDFDDISDGAECYADLPDPLTNSSYRDILVYYQMLQLTSAGEASQSVDNTQAWYTSSKQNRLSAFLKALVAEAKEGEDSETPFLFGFKYNDNESGHTVVVCGYSQDDNGDHEIWIVDPNSYQSGTVLHDYLIMTVASDYSSFSFQDEIRISAGTYLEDVWSRLEFYSIDDIYDDGVQVKTSAAAAESADTAVLKISYGNAFRLENAQGEYLAFDGENYTGDMTVYDCLTAGIEGDMYWNLIVSASSSYVLTEADADASFGITFDGQEYVVSTDGADRVSVTANGIEASGETYYLDVYVETSTVDMVEISAEFEGDASIQYDADADSIAVTGSSDTDEVSVTYYDGADQVAEQADLSAGNLTIDAAAGKEMIEETTGGTTGDTTEGAASGTTEGTAGGSTDASTKTKTQKITIKKSQLTKTIHTKKLKKKKQTFKLKASTSGNGKLTYKKVSGNKKIKVSKAGKVTVKKGLKKGKTYKVKVRITAARTSSYKKAAKTVTLKIKVK